MSDSICKIGSEQVPYFRTEEFSDLMKENEKLMLKFSDAPINSRAVFLTGSGTAGMEATVINCFGKEDKVLIVNGGSFGERFVEICKIHNIEYTEIKLNYFEELTEEHLRKYDGKKYSGFLVNVHETSTGVYYDLEVISKFCKRNNLFLVVDAISSFLADPLSMKESGIDVLIVGSQKGLACPPGISICVLSENAISKINNNEVKSLYLNLQYALCDGERGQTPFTPAVGTLRQINKRLVEINLNGGVEAEIGKVKEIATDFRKRIEGLPLHVMSKSMSNAVTPLKTEKNSAYSIFEILKDEYGIWVCPNGGHLKNEVFRVGHIGNLSIKDNQKLVEALYKLFERGII